MNRKNFQHVEMLARVVEFGAAYVDLFPKNTWAGQSFAELGAALSKVSEHASRQIASRNAVRAGTTLREAAHETLRKQLQRISGTASAIAIDTPGLDGHFRMPNRNRDQALIQGAKVFVHAAEPLKKAFVQHRLPNSFIEDLDAAARQLERTIQEQVSSKTKRAHAATALGDDLAQCLKLLKRVDAIVGNTLADNAPLMAEWDVTRRAGRGPTRTKSPEPAPTPAPAA